MHKAVTCALCSLCDYLNMGTVGWVMAQKLLQKFLFGELWANSFKACTTVRAKVYSVFKKHKSC